MKRNRAFTLIELLGVISLITILGMLAMGGYAHLSESSKKSVAERNVSLLNSALEAYNQSGGMMTLEVLADTPDAASEAFCRLASANSFSQVRGGASVASWQRPVVSTDPEDWRAVWVSGLSSASPASLRKVHKGLGGLRNPDLEQAIESGQIQPARFILVGPEDYQGLPQDVAGIDELFQPILLESLISMQYSQYHIAYFQIPEPCKTFHMALHYAQCLPAEGG